MNRRDFFRKLGGIVVGTYVALKVELPAFKSSTWTEQDIALYNKLPFYLAQMQGRKCEPSIVWERLLTKTTWPPNMGDTKG